MDPTLLCKAFFTLGTIVNVGGTLFPSFRQQIMNYGSRSSNMSTKSETNDSKSQIAKLINFAASYQVPHTWFLHYYLASVASSIFWAIQILSHGKVFRFFASYSQQSSEMTVNQVFLAWLFMAVQGVRRVYECITLTKPSQSKMWIGIWLVGIAYYLVIGISVWIEGISAINVSDPASRLQISKPSIKTFISVSVFIIASGIQHDCHEYLASLEKYTLPEKQWFRLIVCPHYTSECFVYLAIAIVSAPDGQVFNGTVLAGLAFVVSNLAVTAGSTRKWYIEKFGAGKLQGKRRMIPYVY